MFIAHYEEKLGSVYHSRDPTCTLTSCMAILRTIGGGPSLRLVSLQGAGRAAECDSDEFCPAGRADFPYADAHEEGQIGRTSTRCAMFPHNQVTSEPCLAIKAWQAVNASSSSRSALRPMG